MSAIAWTAVENALFNWVVAASGLAAAKVIWSDEGGPRPDAPYIALSLDEVLSVGQDWRVYDDAPDPVAGAELRVRTRGQRTAELQIQYFAALKSGRDALRKLTDVVAALPLHEYAIDVAGCGIAGADAVQVVRGNRGATLEPRAVTTISLHLAAELEARETYVERTQITITETSTDDEREVWIPDPPPP